LASSRRYKQILDKIFIDEHASLFCRTVSDEEQESLMTLTPVGLPLLCWDTAEAEAA
jgi:hypothetical protein